MPTYCPPGVSRPGHYSANIRVPIDNYSMMFFRLRWGLSPMTHEDLVEYKQGGYAYPEMIPGTWKTKANVFNDYKVDRLGQKTFLYTGIKTFPLQDIAMMENQWGPLAKRELEHLTTMDYHMIYLRRKLLKAARAMRDGIEPAGAVHAARPGTTTAPAPSWRTATSTRQSRRPSRWRRRPSSRRTTAR